jgi:hypothetical protein
MKRLSVLTSCLVFSSLLFGASIKADAATDTLRVTYPAAHQISLDVKVGDVIIFDVNRAVVRIDQVYLAFTSVPPGASNPVPVSAGYELNYQNGPLTYLVTVEGTYNFTIHGTPGDGVDTGIITAATVASSSVGNSGERFGFSMTVNPQPSKGAASINFTSDKPADLQLALFDATGKQVHQYDEVKLGSGEYSVPLSSTGLPSGDYYLRASAGGATLATTKVLIVH